MRRRVYTFLGVCLSLTSAQATMMEQLDTKRLTKASSAIHLGKVISREPVWEDSECNVIYTKVKLSVERTIKGSPDKEVIIRIPGGQVKEKDRGMVAHGMASFKDGERTLVFLSRDKDGT